MATFSEKIRILRKNKGWTQAQLAEALSLSESAVQKWETEKNAPPVTELKRLSEMFQIPAAALIDDAIDLPEYYEIDSIATEDFYPRNAYRDSTPHQVLEAGLKKEATLHRFLNPAGIPYSAIYDGNIEICSCERDHEQGMINYWNQD